jgi:hypothetical protein
MDFVGTLARQIGIEESQATALAGGIMGLVKSGVASQGSEEDVAAVAEAVPEAAEWEQAAEQQLGEPGEAGLSNLLGDLFGGGSRGEESSSGGLGSMLGGLVGGVAEAVDAKEAKHTAQLALLIGKIGLAPTHAAMVAPLAYDFLESRLNGQVFELAKQALPWLIGSDGDAAGKEPTSSDVTSTVGNVLGGLFGGN